MALEEVGRPQVATTLTAVTRLNTTTEDGRVEAPPRCTLTGTEGSNPSLSAEEEHLDSSCGLATASTKPGEVTERPKVHDWKSCVRATVPRVRIPPSPLTDLF